MEIPENYLQTAISATVELNIPIEWEFTKPLEYKVSAKMKKANRFIRALARLCKRFGYQAEIELKELEENKEATE